MLNYFLRWGMRPAKRFIKIATKAEVGLASPRELSLLGIMKKQSGKKIQDLKLMANMRVHDSKTFTVRGPVIKSDETMSMGYSDVPKNALKIMRKAITKMGKYA